MAGAAQGSRRGMQYTVELSPGSTIVVVTDQTEVRVGDCVNVEQAGSGTANVRRVSPYLCEAAAEDAVEAVYIEYEPLPALVEAEQALETDISLFDDSDTNLVIHLEAGRVVVVPGFQGLTPDGEMLAGFPLRTKADIYGVPLLQDLDGDRDLELFLGAADGMLRVWDLPYRKPKRPPTWRGLLGGANMPGTPGK